jgi:Helix-turn-helix domain
MTEEQTQNRIKWFLLSCKPDWCKPIDIAMTVIIIARADHEGKCYASQETICKLAKVSTVETLRLCLDRLIEHGWIIQVSRKGSQQSNILMPQYHAIPKDADAQPTLSVEARGIASRYYVRVTELPKMLTKNGRYRMAARPHKSWPQHWALVIQNWLDTGVTAEQVAKVIDHAFHYHVDTAKRGPQCIKPRFQEWLKIVSQ